VVLQASCVGYFPTLFQTLYTFIAYSCVCIFVGAYCRYRCILQQTLHHPRPGSRRSRPSLHVEGPQGVVEEELAGTRGHHHRPTGESLLSELIDMFFPICNSLLNGGLIATTFQLYCQRNIYTLHAHLQKLYIVHSTLHIAIHSFVPFAFTYTHHLP
jgi:hypothetical protein